MRQASTGWQLADKDEGDEDMYIKLDAAGRVCAAALGGILPDGMEIVVPDDFEMERHGDWRMVNGEMVHDPLPEPAPQPDPMEALGIRVAAVEAGQADQAGTLNDLVLYLAGEIGGVSQ